MSKDPVEYLKHIRDECFYILSVTGEGLTKNDFLQNETLKRAITRSLEIIGEATKNIPADYQLKHHSIQYKKHGRNERSFNS